MMNGPANKRNPHSHLPGLPCQLAFSVPRDADQNREAYARDFSVSCVLFSFTCLRCALMLLCLWLGHRAMLSGSTLPLWIVGAHVPYLWKVNGNCCFVKRRLQAQREKKTLKLGATRVFAYEPAQIRASGLHRDEERFWWWTHFVSAEFVGESEGWYSVRLQEAESSTLPSCPPSRAPLIVRPLLLARLFGWRLTPYVLTVVIPACVTFLLGLTTVTRYGWSSESHFALCVLTLQAVCIASSFSLPVGHPHRRMKRALPSLCYLYLLFDSREVTAQEAMGRLQSYIGAPGR